MDTFLNDLRYALRKLLRTPGFTIVAVLTLGLGIGANSAIFSLVDAVLLRPLPYPAPERLMRLDALVHGHPAPFSGPNFLDFRAQNRVFTDMAAWDPETTTLTGAGEPERLQATDVSAGFFGILGVQPALGRTFRPGDNEPGHTAVVVLSDGLWRQRFGADPGILGRAISLDGAPAQVVGVMPAGFAFPREAVLWRPLEYNAMFRDPGNRRALWLRVIARLRPGVTPARAQSDVAAIAGRLQKDYPDLAGNIGASATPLAESMVGDLRTPLLLLLGAVGLVLLIACANVASLLLARASARATELAVRSALGAGRRRLVRQLLTESAVLALLGGGFGLLLGAWGAALLVRLGPGGIPRLEGVGVNGGVILFTAVVALVTALVFGAVPAWQATRVELTESLKEGARGGGARRSTGRLRAGLVVAELALAVMLLSGAGLLLRSFARLQAVDPGFRADHTVAFDLGLPDTRYGEPERVAEFYRTLLERLSALPGVQETGAVSALPLTGFRMRLSFDVKGRAPAPASEKPALDVIAATPGYLRALRIPVLRGRSFTSEDRAGARPVVLLNEEAVRRYFPGEDPIGQVVQLGWPRSPAGEVVGIVRDVREEGLTAAAEPQIYLPQAQVPFASMSVVVRTTGDPARVASLVRREVHALDPDLAVDHLRTVREVVDRSIAEPRLYATLLALFAAVALTLAAVGIFGVMAYTVAQRRRELGIRLALGARPGGVLRLVVGQAAVLVAVGIALGLLGTLALSRVLAGLLFGVSATDPATLAAVAVGLGAVALLASWLPARAATRIAPSEALRLE